MPNFNQVIFIGHLTRDPELTYAASGTPICKCGIAADSGWGDKKKPCFLDITLFGKSAESFNSNMNKGKCARVVGELELDQWEDKQSGAKRSKHALVVRDWGFGDSKAGGDAPAHRPSQKDEPMVAADGEIPF